MLRRLWLTGFVSGYFSNYRVQKPHIRICPELHLAQQMLLRSDRSQDRHRAPRPPCLSRSVRRRQCGTEPQIPRDGRYGPATGSDTAVSPRQAGAVSRPRSRISTNLGLEPALESSRRRNNTPYCRSRDITVNAFLFSNIKHKCTKFSSFGTRSADRCSERPFDWQSNRNPVLLPHEVLG
jgi:hypothetical protein